MNTPYGSESRLLRMRQCASVIDIDRFEVRDLAIQVLARGIQCRSESAMRT